MSAGLWARSPRAHNQDVIPEDEAFNRDGRLEQYYMIRFRQKDLWPEYPFDNDTLQTESPERWLEPAEK
jgi:hypothetical protein